MLKYTEAFAVHGNAGDCLRRALVNVMRCCVTECLGVYSACPKLTGLFHASSSLQTRNGWYILMAPPQLVSLEVVEWPRTEKISLAVQYLQGID